MLRFVSSLYALGLALLFLRLPGVGSPKSVDSAWAGVLQHDWNNGVRVGTDSIFTSGPLGFLFGAGQVFAADGALTRYVASHLAALAAAMALTMMAGRLPAAWRIAYLACTPLVAIYCFGCDAVLTITALGLLSLGGLARREPDGRARFADARPSAWLGFAAAWLWISGQALTKFTYFTLAMLHLAIAAAALLCQRRRATAGVAVAIAATMLLSTWACCGQRFDDLPTFLATSIEIARGYNEIMASGTGEVGAALLLFALVAVLAAAIARALPGAIERGSAAVVLASMFVGWKAGFVRQDIGHTPLYFGFSVLAPFFLLGIAGAHRRPAWPSAIVAVTTAAIALWLDISVCERIGIRLQHVPQQLTERTTASWRGFAAALDAAIARNAEAIAMPASHARVGAEAVDLMGHEQGMLLASGFAFRHRPVFQGYSVYTADLQRRNGEFFRGPMAPRFVFAKAQAFEHRLPMADDSQAWLALFDRYFPVLGENGYLLLEHCRDTEDASKLLLERAIGCEEWLELPQQGADWRELSLDLDYSLLGKLRAFLYRPCDLWLEVRTDKVQRFRIAPCLVRLPFLLDPLIGDTQTFVQSWLGLDPPRVQAIRVVTEPADRALLRTGITVRVFSRQRPVQPPQSTLEERQALLRVGAQQRYPGFSFFPLHVDPRGGTGALGEGADAGVIAHAPCTLTFEWPGGHHVLTADFEIASSAFTNGGRTDGVEFRVEAGDENARKTVFERLLDPLQRAEDRGLQPLRLELDLPQGTPLLLRTLVGPNGDGGYDWSVWRRVRLDPP